MDINFWDVHGLIFILFMCFLPRLTMLFAGICSAFSGVLFWIGWLFVPRLTVAILATSIYWTHNPVLVIFTWFWALGGETTEKKTAHSKFS